MRKQIVVVEIGTSQQLAAKTISSMLVGLRNCVHVLDLSMSCVPAETKQRKQKIRNILTQTLFVEKTCKLESVVPQKNDKKTLNCRKNLNYEATQKKTTCNGVVGSTVVRPKPFSHICDFLQTCTCHPSPISPPPSRSPHTPATSAGLLRKYWYVNRYSHRMQEYAYASCVLSILQYFTSYQSTFTVKNMPILTHENWVLNRIICHFTHCYAETENQARACFLRIRNSCQNTMLVADNL